MTIRFLTVVILVAFATQGPAIAQQGPGPEKLLNRMDGDGDGRIARNEWMGPPPAFRKMDSNSDGYLTAAELQAWQGKGQSRSSGQTPVGTQSTAERKSPSWVDTHVHLRAGSGTYEGALEHAAELMDASATRVMIVMPPPFPKTGRARNRYDVQELSRVTKAFPGRFLFMGGGHLINGIIESTPPDQVTAAIREDFTQKANFILDSGARGFGELGMMHLGHFAGHPSYWVRPDHPLFLLLADIAGQRKAVIDIHMDVVEQDAATPRELAAGDNPPVMKENVASFERFVAHSRDARIVLAHAGWDVTGQWSAKLSRRLLSAHPNLYMSLKVTARGASGENQLMTETASGSVKNEWLAVFKVFPERFFVGSDSFFAAVGAKGRAPGGMTQFNGEPVERFLNGLPPNLARRVASENALAVYGEP